jgi:hypothetical protein
MDRESVDAQITERIIQFYRAMVRRGQIVTASDQLPTSLVVTGGGVVIPDIRLLVEADRPVAGG